MIPDTEEFILEHMQGVDMSVIESVVEAFAIEIFKYNLKQYRTQMLEFNTGEATKFKSFDDITLETIKELENSDAR